MAGRQRPWQVLRTRSELRERSSSRSFFTEREAVDAAIAWVSGEPAVLRPLAYVHNRQSDGGGRGRDDELLLAPSYLVRHDPSGEHVILGTWPAVTGAESDALVARAVGAAAEGESAREGWIGSLTWRRANEIEGRPL
jgi:hypothetical protein